MSNSFFTFKQFTIWHDKCAMKVGTDGVLLGAWVDVVHAKNILDVGAGTGLVSLMLAQRSTAKILGIEIDKEAFSQAEKNIKLSPWENRVKVQNIDFKLFKTDVKYDVIVSNPPYFSDSLVSPNKQRSIARHNQELSFNELIKGVSLVLTQDGVFSLIIPNEALSQVVDIANSLELYVVRQTDVLSVPNSSPKRCLISFSFTKNEYRSSDSLTIELSRHQYTNEYINLTKEYYLKM